MSSYRPQEKPLLKKACNEANKQDNSLQSNIYDRLREYPNQNQCKQKHNQSKSQPQISKFKSQRCYKNKKLKAKMKKINNNAKKQLLQKVFKTSKNNRQKQNTISQEVKIIPKNKKIFKNSAQKKINKKITKIAQKIPTPKTLILFKNNQVGEEFQIYSDKQAFNNWKFNQDCQNKDGDDNDKDTDWDNINYNINNIMTQIAAKAIHSQVSEYMRNFEPQKLFFDCLFKLINSSVVQYANYYMRNFQCQEGLVQQIRQMVHQSISYYMKDYLTNFKIKNPKQMKNQHQFSK